MAIVATTMKTSSQHDMSELPSYSDKTLGQLGFPLVRFFARLDGGLDAFLLARHNFLAAFDQVLSAFAQFTSLFLGVVAAFLGLRGQILACLLAGFGSEQNSHQRSDTQAHEKKRYFGTNVIGHKRTSESQTSIGVVVRQGRPLQISILERARAYGTVWRPLRLPWCGCGFRRLTQGIEDPLSLMAWKLRGEVIDAELLQTGDAAEFS